MNQGNDMDKPQFPLKIISKQWILHIYLNVSQGMAIYIGT